VLLALLRGWLRPPAAALALCALLYLDLWSFGHRYNPTNPASEVFPPTPSLRFLQEHIGRERFAAGGDLLRPNVSMLFGLRDLRGYEDVVDRDFDLVYGPTLSRLREKLWVGVAPRIHDPGLEREDVRLLELASVRYLLSARPLRGPVPVPYRRLSAGPGLLLYESESALPRAYVVQHARVVPDVASARAALLEPGFDPRREVVLVGEGASAPGAAARGAPASVAWRLDEPGAVVLEASLPEPGYLVLGDRHAPEWEARLDGAPVPVLRANGVFRAVAVPPGTHEVRFRYRPRLVRASAAASAVAGLALLALAIPGRAPAERAGAGSA
jgi:hypothetical protein